MSPLVTPRITVPRAAALVVALAAAVLLTLVPTWRAEAAPSTGTPPTAPPRPAGPIHLPTGSVLIKGQVAHVCLLRFTDLAKYPQHTETVTYQSGKGTEKHTFTGPLLYDVLLAAKPGFRDTVKNDLLRYAVLVHASDGYESVVSWPEIDPGFGHSEVLLASAQDGVSLAADGPRLTAPSDIKGGRYVSGVTSITLVRVGS